MSEETPAPDWPGIAEAIMGDGEVAMSPRQIELVLGHSAVEAVEAAVQQACEAADRHRGTDGVTAVQELLLGMLAAVIITPGTGAQQRAEHAGSRIREIVDASIRISQPPH